MDKSAQRRQAKTAVRELGEQKRLEYSLEICRRLLALPEIRLARHILSYMATPLEVDLGMLNTELAGMGKTAAFPAVLGDGFMEARVLGADGRLRRGSFGIREPEGGDILPPEDIELVLVPCLAFDKGCMRLGHGAGYYDRYLPRCKNALFISPAFEAQKLERVCAEGHDCRLHAVVTERRVYKGKCTSASLSAELI